MKLGTETGSLVNHIYSRTAHPAPQTGMAATLLMWSDREPATVIYVSDKLVQVQCDSAVRTDLNGMSDSQTYEYFRNPRGAVYEFSKNRAGAWEYSVLNPVTGRRNKASGTRVIFGRRDKHIDFSF